MVDVGATVQSELYGSGPWLVCHGPRPSSPDLADAIATQCRVRGVSTDVRPIDEIGAVNLDRYPGLVIVLPSEPGTAPSDTLRPFVRLLALYRANRRRGLDALLNGNCRWFEAGVVQVAGLRAVLSHPMIRSAADRHHVCARHHTDATEPTVNVFTPYLVGPTRATAPSVPLDTDNTAEPRRLWRYVKSWGVTDIRLVPSLRACIEECRRHFEDPRFPTLFRPVAGVPGNRLYFVLEEPNYRPTARRAQAAWMGDGARVWRYVRDQLQEIVPTVARPGARDGTKGAQRELRDLYLALRALDEYLRLTDEIEWQSLT